MNTYTIRLSDTLDNFIKDAVAEGGYADANDYIVNELLKNQRLKKLPKKLSDLEKLKLFNRKAEKFEQYQLWEYVKNQQPTVTVSSGKLSTNFPDDEFLEAPLITLRLFMQNNDHISINNISNIYKYNQDIPIELKDNFVDYRSRLNNFLDKESLFRIQHLIWLNDHKRNTTKFTHREVLESLLYGEIAHFTKMEDYEIIYGNPSYETSNLMLVMKIMEVFKDFILCFKDINIQAIPHIKS